MKPTHAGMLVALVLASSCRGSKPSGDDHPAPANHLENIPASSNDDPTKVPATPELLKEREVFIANVMEFTHLTHDQVLDKITVHNTGMRDEWNEWEKKGPMTDARIKEFYKQTSMYIYDLGLWHLWGPAKHESDLALVDELKKYNVKTVLDFGGGVGFNSFPIAQAGIDVTLADLDSVTLKFAQFRADKLGIKMKFWRSDVEPMPPEPKYDAILCLDVLEHLPKDELHTIVDKLVKLKKPTTRIVIHAPFGRTSVHPMHRDLTEDTKQQVLRLQNDLPPKD